MDREAQYKRLFQLTSVVTDSFPEGGARFLDVLFKSILGNSILLKVVTEQAIRKVRRAEKFNRFLVAADLNIGDSVIALSSVNALRKIFPTAEIDLVIKKSTNKFIEGNPDISNLYPVYIGAPFPTESDLTALADLAGSKNYDLIINFSPMIEDKIFGKRNVVNFSIMAVEMVRGEGREEAVNNVSYQGYKFIEKIFHDSLPPGFGDQFSGADIYLSEETVESASEFLLSHEVSREKPIIMFNSDASSRFTRIPFDVQHHLLKRLSDFDCTILLGDGHAKKFLGYELVYSLPAEITQKIVIVPASMEIDVYAALVDFADVFITGDTGPLHLAAARKFSRGSGKSLRNKTAIFSIFGGTPPRIYGYDSKTVGFLAANQDAPSRAFISKSLCRNITCINKMAKTCREVRCFKPLDQDEIISEVASHLESIRSLHIRQKDFISPK
ncbi:MAG: glycosyltransferase family 9 protein [Candidatus Kryptoniota bacterium]